MNLSPRTLLGHGLVLGGGAAAQAGAAFLSQLVLMRLVAPESFGQFALTLASCGLIQTVLTLRLNVLVIRASADDLHSHWRDLTLAALTWETLITSVITLVWLAVSGLLSSYALVLLASLSLTHWMGQAMAFYERSMAYGKISAVETGSQLLSHGIAMAAAFLGAGIGALYLREVVVVLLRGAAFIHLRALPTPVWRFPTLAEWRQLAKAVRGFWLEGVLEGIFARLSIVGVGTLTDNHGTGIFSQTQRLAMIPHQLIGQALVRLYANAFCRVEGAGRRVLLRHALLGLLAVFILLAVATALWADPIIPWLFGEQWREAALIMPAMAGIIVFFSAVDLLRSYCFAIGRIRLILAGRVVQSLSFVAGLIWSSQQDGVLTALAWSTSVAYALTFLFVGGALALGTKKPR